MVGKEKIIVSIDDSMWGCPLGGVIVGMQIGNGSKPVDMDFETVGVEFFRPVAFDQKLYLKEYSRLGRALLAKNNCKPETHRVKICTGYVNSLLASDLLEEGWGVETGKIEGPLQSRIEEIAKTYIKMITKQDMYYDPKDIPKHQIGKRYYDMVNWAIRNKKTDLLKTGWGKLRQYAKEAP